MKVCAYTHTSIYGFSCTQCDVLYGNGFDVYVCSFFSFFFDTFLFHLLHFVHTYTYEYSYICLNEWEITCTYNV